MNSSENKKQGASPVDIFLFAAHHASGNIAAQRYRALMRYVDPSLYQIHVFTRLPEDGLQRDYELQGPNVSVHLLEGQCVGRLASPLVVSLVFLSAFFSKLPFAFCWLAKHLEFRSCWFINALILADSICQSKLSQGRKCFVIGTYSPLDALVASSTLSARFGLPNLQDFRDGFVFESLGRKGRVASLLRSVIERRVVQSATMITSVSSALVDDFRSRYATAKVELLSNGYDPAEFGAVNGGALSSEALAIIGDVSEGKLLIGHFGRVSDSDYSSFGAFRHFVHTLKAEDGLLDRVHLLFAGKLTLTEREALESLACSKTVLPPVDRQLAQELMRQCDILLLVTGDRVSCATGKLFEYMATRRNIVCFSMVNNEAAKILKATGAGKTVLVGESDAASSWHEVSKGEHETRAMTDISAYDRKNQAALLSDWIQKACL